MAPPTGLYVHIPYCTSICPYCDFNAYVAPKAPWKALGAALLRELAARAPLFQGPLESIYFGGGTPSLAPADLIAELIEAAKQRIGVKAAAEITLEANPGTLDAAKLAALKAAGIGRLSMGWQSTNNKILRVLGRGHSAQDSQRAFLEARQVGFDAISLDLIFAVPSQTQRHLAADLEALAKLSPEHVSLYAMTFKAGTPFERRRQKGTLAPAAEQLECGMMQQIDVALSASGYEHYEVSNYAKPGRRAVHNSLYWQGGQYLGIGPGAHSFLRQDWTQGWRWESVRKPSEYLQAWSASPPGPVAGPPQPQDPSVQFVERLDSQQLRLERLFCGMRHIDGLPQSLFVPRPDGACASAAITAATDKGWIHTSQGRVRPTRQGLRHVDALAVMLS